MLIICYYYYGFLLSNISTYHLKVARRPVEQWNGIQCTRGDVIILLMLLDIYSKNDASIIYPGLLATFK